MHIRFPNGIVAGGEVVEIAPCERLVFTYGFESGQPIGLGASRVTITLEETPLGTVLRLRHELPLAAVRDEHVQGWRYQLAVFANLVAKEAHAAASAQADRFFACWAETDAPSAHGLASWPSPPRTSRSGIRTRAPPASTTSSPTSARRRGSCRASSSSGRATARQCQGTALVDWVVKAADGSQRARGTNVFDLAPDGRIARVTGVWE